MKPFLIILAAVLSAGLAPAQQKPKSSPAAPPLGLTIEETSFPLPLELRDKFREFQHVDDTLEIENQKMLVKIAQNRAKQAELLEKEIDLVTQFARDKNLDPTLYEMDPEKVVLRRKKGSK